MDNKANREQIILVTGLLLKWIKGPDSQPSLGDHASRLLPGESCQQAPPKLLSLLMASGLRYTDLTWAHLN